MNIREFPRPNPDPFEQSDLWAVRFIWCWLLGVPLLVVVTLISASIEAATMPLNAEIKELRATNENLWVLLQDRDCFLAWQEPRLRQWGLEELAADMGTTNPDIRTKCRRWTPDVVVFRGDEYEGLGATISAD